MRRHRGDPTRDAAQHDVSQCKAAAGNGGTGRNLLQEAREILAVFLELGLIEERQQCCVAR